MYIMLHFIKTNYTLTYRKIVRAKEKRKLNYTHNLFLHLIIFSQILMIVEKKKKI